jgi:hypothetical protein
MKLRTGLEKNYEGRSIAWIPKHPGCSWHKRDYTAQLCRLTASC